jgi:hypothetical protein
MADSIAALGGDYTPATEWQLDEEGRLECRPRMFNRSLMKQGVVSRLDRGDEDDDGKDPLDCSRRQLLLRE